MRFRVIAITILFCAVLTFSSVNVSTAEPSELMFDDTISGPYLDKVRYEIIVSSDQQVLALQGGAIDILDGPIDQSYLPVLEADPDTEVSSVLRNGYGHITINCRDAPLNWTALRRAFAYAYNKTKVQTDIFNGLSILHDSLVPSKNELFCVEDELQFDYYTSEVAIGNALLDAAGFTYNGVTGFRDDPNGNPIHLVIAYSASSPTLAGGCSQIAVDALLDLGISAETNAGDFNTYIANMYNHGSYDMIFLATNFYDYDVSWLKYKYGSAYDDVYGQNPSNFVNSSFDSHIDGLSSGDYQDVFDACREMQKILHYNVPLLVTYENYDHAAYRNDRFDGHIVDVFKNVGNEWTNLKAHLNLLEGGPFSGTLRISLGQEPDSFNPFVTNSRYSWEILNNMFDYLIRLGPDGNRRPGLAESHFMETHADNSMVPAGHMRFTFDIIDTATWTDGTPLTADDVEYTFTYLFESMAYGNPMGLQLADLFSVTSPLPNRVVVEFSSESYWHARVFSRIPIFQKALLQSLGYTGWNTWNPIFSSDPNPTSGPFNITDMDPGDYVELSYNPNFRNGVRGTGSDQPTVDGPSHVTAVDGIKPNLITWNMVDDNPLLYRVFKNDSLSVVEYNTDSTILLNINSHLAEYGTYNFTIQVQDWEYQSGYHSVIVNYVPDTFDPVIEGPDDFNITFDDVGENVVWNVTDNNPSNYSVLLNDTEIASGVWDNDGPVVYSLDDLDVGVYEVTLIADDLYGYSSSDSVIIRVKVAPMFALDTMMLLGIAGVAGVVVVVVVVYRIKRGG